MKLVLDASFAIKLYVAEPDSGLATRWVSQGVGFLVPDLFFIEVGQALLRHQRDGLFGLDTLTSALAELAGLTEIPFGASALFPRAFELAEALHHGLPDCVYLSRAERCKCPVLTADAKAAHEVRQTALSVDCLLLTEKLP